MNIQNLCIKCYTDIIEILNTLRTHKYNNILQCLKGNKDKFQIDVINGEKYVSIYDNKQQHNNLLVVDWNVDQVQYWLWKLYQDASRDNNISESQWNIILAIFEANNIDGKTLIHLNETDLFKMNINSVGIQKLILSSVLKMGTQQTQISNDQEQATKYSTNAQQSLPMDNLHTCLMNHLQRHSSADNNINCIYEHDILEYYNIRDAHDWFKRQVIEYYYDQFNIMYYDHVDNDNNFPIKCLKIHVRQSCDIEEIDDIELKRRLSHIVQEHPIGIDIVSLLQEYESLYRHMFKSHVKYFNLTDRLKALDFIVTVSSSGYIVFNSYK